MFKPKKIIPLKARIFAHNILWKFRQCTWRFRKLPDFLIIGAMKSGTTSLYEYLSQHPQIDKPTHKEIYFFSTNQYKKGLQWYKAHFPLKHCKDKLTFEASTDYIFVPNTPKRIHQRLPEVKLILLLRNPVDRAISHYYHEIQRYREHLSISEALEYEDFRLPPVESLFQHDIKISNYNNNPFIHFSYKSRGVYVNQIKRFFKYFPHNKIFIVNSEKFYSQTNDVMKQIYQFLEIDTNFLVKDMTPRNVTSNSIKTHVSEDIYKYLYDYFKPYNQELYKLLGQEYNW